MTMRSREPIRPLAGTYRFPAPNQFTHVKQAQWKPPTPTNHHFETATKTASQRHPLSIGDLILLQSGAHEETAVFEKRSTNCKCKCMPLFRGDSCENIDSSGDGGGNAVDRQASSPLVSFFFGLPLSSDILNLGHDRMFSPMGTAGKHIYLAALRGPEDDMSIIQQ